MSKSTIGKNELALAIAEKLGSSKEEAKICLNTVLSAIEEKLVEGNDINIIGLMSFKIVEQAERKGRNPSTGKEITIPAGKKLKITPGKSIKDAISNA